MRGDDNSLLTERTKPHMTQADTKDSLLVLFAPFVQSFDLWLESVHVGGVDPVAFGLLRYVLPQDLL